jgi:hypothetical protein
VYNSNSIGLKQLLDDWKLKHLNEQDRLNHYREMMEEVRSRLEVIKAILTNAPKLDIRFVREICYLQLRYLCEIVALACLLAQGSFTKRLLATYEADKIINELHKLNPYLFPQPCLVTMVGGVTRVKGLPSQPKYLTRDDIPKLWGKCGDVLHLSPLTKTLRPRSTNMDSLSDVQEWFEKIFALLNEHLLILVENKKMLVVNMYAPYFQGRPAVTLLNFEVTPR